MPKTAADTMAFTMPSFRFLSDEEVNNFMLHNVLAVMA